MYPLSELEDDTKLHVSNQNQKFRGSKQKSMKNQMVVKHFHLQPPYLYMLYVKMACNQNFEKLIASEVKPLCMIHD